MFVRMTFTKIDPADFDGARDLYNSEENSGVIRRQRGTASTASWSPWAPRARPSP